MVYAQIDKSRTFCALCYVVFLASDGGYDVETFYIALSESSILVNGIVNRPVVVAMIQSDIHNVLSEVFFLRNLSHKINSVLADYYHIVQSRAVGDVFAVFEFVSHEAIGIIAVKLFVCYGNGGFFYGVEAAYFRFPFSIFAEFAFDTLKVCNGVVNQIIQIMLHGCDVVFYCNQGVVCSVAIVFGYTVYGYFPQAMHIVEGYFAYEIFDKGLQAFQNGVIYLLIGGTFFHSLVNPFFYEDSLQGNPIPFLVKFA